jgi:arabinose-5-phosphate isomerase
MLRNSTVNGKEILEIAQLSMKEQAKALNSLADAIDNEFVNAVNAILDCQGRLVISGRGKSGHIGKKIAASLASTGTRAFFMHPAEAFHGDLGMVAPEDIVLLISNSGESDEILKLLPSLKKFGVLIIGLHGNPTSSLGKNSGINLIVNVSRETCPHNLAPTTSAMAALAMGDALTVALMRQRGFQPEDFAKYHPGGSLGRQLLYTVKDVMEKDYPIVKATAKLKHCLLEMTDKKIGIAVVEDSNEIIGVLTDGDIRRSIITNDVKDLTVSDIMSKSPICCNSEVKIAEADAILKNDRVNSLVVLDGNKSVGIYERV